MCDIRDLLMIKKSTGHSYLDRRSSVMLNSFECSRILCEWRGCCACVGDVLACVKWWRANVGGVGSILAWVGC